MIKRPSSSLADRLRKAGIRHYDKLIHDQPKRWLIKNFSQGADEYPVNVARLMRNIIWQTQMPAYSASSAIVVDEYVFTASKHYDLVCVSKKTGKLLWVRTSSPYDAATKEDRAKQPGSWKAIDRLATQRDALNRKIASGPNSDAYTLGKKKDKIQTEMDKLLAKIDPTRFKVRWRADGGMANGTPVSGGKNVYVWNAMGVMACYDFKGKRKWINHQARKHQEHGYHATPLLIGDKVIIPMKTYLAFDKNSGELAWESEVFQSGNDLWYSSAASVKVGGKTCLVAADGSLYDPATGKLIVKRRFPAYKANATPVTNDGYVCFIGSSYPNKWDKKPIRYYKLPKRIDNSLKPEVHTPTYPWDEKVGLGGITASPLFHDGLLYIVTSRGTLFVYDVKTDELVYRQKLEFDDAKLLHGHRPYGCGVMSSPTLAGGNIYIMGNTSVTLVIKPGRKFKLVSRNVMAREFTYTYRNRREGMVSCPFFDGNRIYIRGQKHLYCIGKK